MINAGFLTYVAMVGGAMMVLSVIGFAGAPKRRRRRRLLENLPLLERGLLMLGIIAFCVWYMSPSS